VTAQLHSSPQQARNAARPVLLPAFDFALVYHSQAWLADAKTRVEAGNMNLVT